MNDSTKSEDVDAGQDSAVASNAERLIEDARFLSDNQRFASAFALRLSPAC
jgi:AbiV family abortive infection protein